MRHESAKSVVATGKHREPDNIREEYRMKADIHPNYGDIKVTCSCGNSFTTGSTAGQDLSIDVCSACHPFYTGKQKLVDTAGRIDKFKKKYGKK